MKKLFFVSAMVTGSFIATAQHVEFGVKGGLNVASASVKNAPVPSVDPRVSFHIGGLAHIHLSSLIAIQPELTFSGQGYKADGTGGGSVRHTNLNYLNLPVLVQFMTASGFRFETGPQLGALLSANYKASPIDEDVKDQFKPIDFSWDFGAGYLTRSGFGVDARYNLGVSKINEDPSYTTRNAVFQVGVFYQFKPMKHK